MLKADETERKRDTFQPGHGSSAFPAMKRLFEVGRILIACGWPR